MSHNETAQFSTNNSSHGPHKPGTLGANNSNLGNNANANNGNVADDATHIRQLQEAFATADKTGTLEKKMLTPAVCRTDAMRLWRDVLNANVYNGLKVIQLRWCAMQSAGAKLLADGLGNSCMNSLETLDLMGNEIGVSGSRAISQLLAPGVDLDSFQVQDSRSVLAAFEHTSRIGCIKTLVLSYNCTSDAGCGYLGKAICISNTINTLELENCEIGDNGCKYLRRGIERNQTIRVLNIAANRFGDLGAREIQSFLLRNSSLAKLDISRNRLGPQRTMEIAKGLTMNRSLKNLRMNINRIGARGAQLLAKMLINNHSLEELELSYNEIFNDGVQVLAQGLVQNHGLKRIVLWYNGLEDAAARQLARALHQRSKQAHFRNDMVQAIAESQPSHFFIVEKGGAGGGAAAATVGGSGGKQQAAAAAAAQNKKSRHHSSKSKPRPHPETYPICEKIVDYLPVYMYFEVDLSHNRRITKNGINALLEVAASDSIAIRGLKELLSKDRREREIAALAKTSLY
eukprot:CAMPEP_0202689788 /NCGR_PEP_ID=MMETSP1385-20130828/4969_1 /ASSEMBLY_ACC=CAM_ASM_000861 /TAXON_ID=933848 /ORGANISM="Elphidium margaritaceum" /LENGTH=515 /DNA_ID=CAMNT_0049344977 /DNA_START=237 /DNA_END=1784 /DNA_ORIENTATION=-